MPQRIAHVDTQLVRTGVRSVLFGSGAGRLPELRFTRTYWLMSHPDTHDTRRVAQVYAAITRAVQEAKGRFVLG